MNLGLPWGYIVGAQLSVPNPVGEFWDLGGEETQCLSLLSDKGLSLYWLGTPDGFKTDLVAYYLQWSDVWTVTFTGG